MQQNEMPFGHKRMFIRLIRIALRLEKQKQPCNTDRALQIKKLSVKQTAARLGVHVTTLWRHRNKLKPIKKDGEAPYYLEHEVNNHILNAKP